MTKTQAIQLVTTALRRHARTLGSYGFDVVPEMVRREYAIWHMPVRPTKQPPRRGVYYDFLNDVEDDVRKKHRLNVLLVPVNPTESVKTARRVRDIPQTQSASRGA